jgi:hypothetical protein
MSGMSDEYGVVMNGGVLGGWELEEVIDAFAALSRVDSAKAKLFFRAKRKLVKRCADANTANIYHEKLAAIGVDTSVITIEAEPAVAADSAPAPAVDEDSPLSLEPLGGVDGDDEEGGSGMASGSTMICPSCKSLQPREEQCPGCGALVEKFRAAQQAEA